MSVASQNQSKTYQQIYEVTENQLNSSEAVLFIIMDILDDVSSEAAYGIIHKLAARLLLVLKAI